MENLNDSISKHFHREILNCELTSWVNTHFRVVKRSLQMYLTVFNPIYVILDGL